MELPVLIINKSITFGGFRAQCLASAEEENQPKEKGWWI